MWQKICLRIRNMAEWVILAVIIYSAVILLLTKLLTPVYNKYPFMDKFLLVLALIWICGFSIAFVNGAKVLPDSDPKSVYDIAVRMFNGDMGAVVPTGSYLSLCPYQTGLIFIFEKIMRVFNITDPMFIYTTYIYGDVPSMALILFSAWMFLAFERTFEEQGGDKNNTGNIVIGKKFVMKRTTFLRWTYALSDSNCGIWTADIF